MAEIQYPMREYYGRICVNGQMMDYKDYNPGVGSHVASYGSGVFEGVIGRNGQMRTLKDHLRRFLEGIAEFKLECPYDIDQLASQARQVVKENNLVDFYLRPIAFLDDTDITVRGEQGKTVIAFFAFKYLGSVVAGSQRLTNTGWTRAAKDALPVNTKSAPEFVPGRLASLTARETLRVNQDVPDEEKYYTDAYFLDANGNIADTPVTNMIFVKGKKLFYPKTKDIMLRGITMSYILTLALKLGYEVASTTISPDKVSQYDGIFMTGTAAGMAPVTVINIRGKEIEFPVTAAYEELKERYEHWIRQSEADQDAYFGMKEGLGLERFD